MGSRETTPVVGCVRRSVPKPAKDKTPASTDIAFPRPPDSLRSQGRWQAALRLAPATAPAAPDKKCKRPSFPIFSEMAPVPLDCTRQRIVEGKIRRPTQYLSRLRSTEILMRNFRNRLVANIRFQTRFHRAKNDLDDAQRGHRILSRKIECLARKI